MKNVTTVNSIVDDSSCSCTGNYSIRECNMIHPLPRNNYRSNFYLRGECYKQ